MMAFRPGYIPDPPKAGDWGASELLGAGPVPPSARNFDLVPGILHQGGLGSCAANAVAYAIRAAMIVAGYAPTEIISRLFLYYLARASHGAAMIDGGTYLRAIFEVANKFGFCPESFWAYSDDTNPNTGRAFKIPSHAALRAAFDQREPTEYRRIYETGYERIDVIKRALAVRHFVVLGTDVSVAMVRGDQDHLVLKPPTHGEPIAGGHAMALAGYDGDDFDVPQSWGEERGQAGWMRMSADYLAWARTRDLWIVRYAPNFSETA